MESADDINLHEIYNSRVITDDAFINQEVITIKVGNCENDDTEGHSKSLKVKEIPHIDRLPVEVWDIIFYQYLSPSVRKSTRLVCKTWYYRSNRNEKLTIRSNLKTEEARRDFKYLDNCGFQSLSLKLRCLNFNKKCMPVWGNVWGRIHSLRLSFCRLRDRAFDNIILHCDNLEYLEIRLLEDNIYDRAADFCTPSTLESLDCIRPKLKTLKIVNDVGFYVGKKGCYFKKWERIFNRLVHIFPNLVHYGVSSKALWIIHSKSESGWSTLPKFEFSLESNEISNRSDLASCLANALCVDSGNTNNFSWRNALDALSASRLTAVSLVFWKQTYTEEDKITLFKFFSCHRSLKFIELDPYCYNDDWNDAYKEIVSSLIYQLLEFNPQLRTLHYCKYVDWIMRISRTEFKQFCSIVSKLDHPLITDNLVLERSSISSKCTRLDPFLKILSSSSHFIHQHLCVQDCGDGVLQRILQCSTNLETLKIDFWNVTNFGITGSRDSLNVGYSIKRLRNLKCLEFTKNDECQIGDEIFNECDFPKLKHLGCFMPMEFSTFVLLKQKLPVLSEIVFIRVTNSFMRKIKWDTKSKVRLSPSKLKELFAIFPMLKSVSFVDRSTDLFTGQFSNQQSREVVQIYRESTE